MFMNVTSNHTVVCRFLNEEADERTVSNGLEGSYVEVHVQISNNDIRSKTIDLI